MPADNTPHLIDASDQKVRVAKRWCAALNVIALGVSFWAVLPGTSPVAIFAAMLMPLVALFVLKYSRGMVTLDFRKQSAPPTVAGTFMMPPLLIAVRAFANWHVLEWGNFWLPFALISGCMNGVSLWLARDTFLREKKIIFCLFVSALYGYGATLYLNGVLDPSPSTFQHAIVVNKHTVSGKHTSYHLTLSAWRPNMTTRDVTVASDFYGRHPVGDTVTVAERAGFLRIPYFYVR